MGKRHIRQRDVVKWLDEDGDLLFQEALRDGLVVLGCRGIYRREASSNGDIEFWLAKGKGIKVVKRIIRFP